jgi:DUF3040 family protein
MALPMDEQRILEEMERTLALDDPRLAAKLAAFGQPGVAHVLRTRRARAVLSLLMLAVIGCVAAVIYLVSAFRLTGGAQQLPQSVRSSQSANRAPARQSASPPLATSVHCIVLVTPTHCTTWAPGASATHPATNATDQLTKYSPAKSAAAKP